jgi:hypothetical protein
MISQGVRDFVKQMKTSVVLRKGNSAHIVLSGPTSVDDVAQLLVSRSERFQAHKYEVEFACHSKVEFY